MGLAIQIILIDARTGIVKSLRLIGATTDFSREFRATILRQFEQPFSKRLFDKKIKETYINFTPDELAKRGSAIFRIKRI